MARLAQQPANPHSLKAGADCRDAMAGRSKCYAASGERIHPSQVQDMRSTDCSNDARHDREARGNGREASCEFFSRALL